MVCSDMTNSSSDYQDVGMLLCIETSVVGDDSVRFSTLILIRSYAHDVRLKWVSALG
jgi:hypothetical protein